MGRNPSYVIEVETRLTDIKDQIKKYETDLKSLQKKADDMGLGENVAKNIQEAMEKLEKLQTEYTESIKKFAKTKISSEEYEEFAKSVTEQFESIDKTMDEMKENILSFSQTINNINADSIEKTVSDIKRAFRDFKHDTREAINLLKEFQAFVNNSYGGKELRGLEKTIKQLKEVFDNPINFSGDSKDLLKLKGELIDLYKQYRNLKDMASKSTSSTELYKKQQQMGDLLLKMEDRAKKIASIKGIGIDDIFNSDYKIGTQTTLSFYTKSIAEETDELSKALKERRDKLQKEAESFAHTTASTFEFKDGGIQIPVVLDSVAMSKCEDSLKDLIDTLSNVSKNNPVDVTLRLFPLKTTKEEQKEVDKYIKNINAQIPNLPDGELKDNVSKFMNQFEKEYQKALMLKIKVGFSDEVKDVERKIELIRQAAKKANIEINPYFTVTEEESNKLKAQLEELQSDFSFDLTKSITKMSDSLQALLKTDNIETWSNHFVNALDRVKNKLNEMKDLIQPLARLYDGSTGKRTPGRPKKDDLEDQNVIDRFSRTMALLNQTLAERDKKPKFNAGEFIGDIQSEIDKANIPVEVPIEANVDGFIQDIESKIGRVAINVDVGSVGVISGSNISGNTIPVINAKEVQIESTETTTKTKTEDTSKKTIGSSSKNKNTSKINNELINGVSKKFIEEEFKNVYFKNNQDYSFSKNIDKTEEDARHKFWDIYGKYVSLLSKTNTLNSVISRKQGKEESDEDYTNSIKKAKKELKETVNASNELLKKNPFLSSVKLGMSKAQKNALLDKYFKDNNISRKSKISEDTYFENLGRRVTGKGEFKLNKPGARKEMQDIIQKYAGYKALGGAKDLRELTDNPEALKKLQKAYTKLTGTLIETKKANKDVVTSSEEITRKSKYEGVSTDELNQKYKELAEEKKAILDRSEDAFIGNTLRQQEKVGRITNDLSEMYRTLKKAKELEEKGLVTAPNKSIEELRKMGYEMNKYGNPIDAKSLYEYADRIKKRLISNLGLGKEFFEQFGKKSLGDLGKEAFVTSRKNKLIVPLDEEMNNISREIELRKIESQQIKVNTVEVKNNTEEKKKNSVESDKKSDISDVAKETEEVKKQTEEIKNNTKEKQKNKKELYDEQKKSSDLLAQARNKDNKYNKRDSRKNKKVDKIISETDEALNATLNGLKSFISVLDKDDLQLNTKKGKARRDFIVDEYKKYREAGGQTPIEDFTENKDIKKKLGKIWNDARKDIDESVWAKKSDSSISVTKNIKNESDAIKENTAETQKNIEAKKELAAKKNKDDINDNFEKLRALVSSQGDLKQNTKPGKHNLKTAVNQYQKYVEAGGTRPITDLTDNIKAQEKLKKAYEATTIAVKEQNEVVSRSDILTSIGKRVSEDKIDFGNLSQDVLQKLFNNTMELVDSNKIKSVEEATDYFEEILNNYKNNTNKSEPSFVDKKDIEKKSFDDTVGEINRQKDKLFELYAEQFNELYVEAETAITSDDGSDEAKQRIINVYKKILDTATNTNFAQPIIESISKISFDEGSIEGKKYIDFLKKDASVSLNQLVNRINGQEEGIKAYRDDYNDVINDGIDKIDNEILFILKDHIESMFRVLSRNDIGVREDVLKRIHDYNTSSFNAIQEKTKEKKKGNEFKTEADYYNIINERRKKYHFPLKPEYQEIKNDIANEIGYDMGNLKTALTMNPDEAFPKAKKAFKRNLKKIRNSLSHELFENINEDDIQELEDSAVKTPLSLAFEEMITKAIQDGLLSAKGELKSMDALEQLYPEIISIFSKAGVDIEKSHEFGKTYNQNNLSSGATLPSQIGDIYGEIIEDENGIKHIQSDIGLTYDQLIEKIRKENEEIEKGNGLFKEREALFKDGVVVDSLLGDENHIGEVPDIKGIDRDLHTHPNEKGKNSFSPMDMLSYYFSSSVKPNKIQKFDLVTGNKPILSLDLSNMTADNIEALSDVYTMVAQLSKYPFSKEIEHGIIDAPPEEYGDIVEKYRNLILKQMVEELGGKLDIGEIDTSDINNEILENIKKVSIEAARKIFNNENPLDVGHWAHEQLYIEPQQQSSQTPVSTNTTQQKTKKKSEIEAIEREKKEVAALIDEMYRLQKIEDDFGIDDFSKMADTIVERYNVSATLSKYFHFPANELDQMNPDYYAKQYGEKYGEEYVEGVSSKTSDAEQAGAELPNAAKKGTAEAQDSHSPSKVAELLGEYWGEGYANGILNTQAKVKNAVRALVETGKLTAEELIEDSNNKESDTKSASKATLKDIDAGKGLTRMGNEFVGHIKDVDAKSYVDSYADSLYEHMKNHGDNLKKRLTKAEKQAIQAAIKATKDADDFADKNGLDILSDALEEIAEEDRVKKEVKQKSSTKGQLNKIINQFNKADALTMDEIDKADSKFKEWIEKAEKLGMDTDAFRKAYREARSKFILDEEDVDKDETKYEIKDKKSPIIPTDPKERKKVANGLFKEQKSYYSEILNYEKELAIAQADQDDFMIDHYKTRLDDTQKLYDETTKQIEALADENEIQKQSIELSKLRRKNEDEIAKIVANRLSAEQKKKDQEAQNQYFKEAEERNKQREAEEKARLKAEEDERKANEKKVTDEEKAQEKYNDRHLKEAMKRTDKDLATRQKDVYDELGSKVQEYTKLRKIIAQGKELDGDTERVENLKNEIEQLNKELRNTPLLFDKNLETRAMQGMDTIEDDVLRIQTDLSQKEQNRLSTQYEGLKNRLKSSGYDIGFEIENGKPTERFKLVLEDILERIQKINDTDLDVVTEDDIREAENLLEEVRQIRKEGKLPTNKTANENSVQKALTQINSILSENTKGSFRKTKVYDDLVELQKQFKSFDTSRPQSELAALTTKLLKTKAEFEDLSNTVKGKNLFQTFADRLHGTTAQLLAQYLSFQDIIRYARTAFTTIQDLDYQLVDLRKTAKMSTSEMEGFYLSSNDVAKQLGITTSEVIQQASAWSRLNNIGLLYGNI